MDVKMHKYAFIFQYQVFNVCTEHIYICKANNAKQARLICSEIKSFNIDASDATCITAYEDENAIDPPFPEYGSAETLSD